MGFRDPRVYCILCLDTNMDVEYSTTHLFDEEGKIVRTRQEHGSQYPAPYDELGEQIDWGAEQLRSLYAGDFNPYVG